MDVTRRAALVAIVLLCTSFARAQGPPAINAASLTSGVCVTEGQTSAGCVALNTSSYAGLSIQVTGTWSGTLTFRGSTDGATFQALNCAASNSTTAVTSSGSNGLWKCGIAALRYVEVIFTAYTSGTAVVTMQASSSADGSGTSAAGSGSNPAASATGSAVPSSASYTGLNSGGTLVGAPGDITNGQWVNCKAGCAAAGDSTAAAQNITSGSGNGSTFPNGPAPSGLALAGDRAAAFQLAAGGTLIATITPQCSTDGGTTYYNAYFQDFFTGALTTTQVIASGQAVTTWQVLCPAGSSHAQLKTTAFTSGSAAFTGRATVAGWPPVDMGVVTTAAPSYTTGQIAPVSLTSAGAARVDGSGVTQPVSGTFWQATQPVSGTVTANQGGTWTVQPGNTANTTAWKVDGSAVTQPVSGTFWQATQPVSGTVTTTPPANASTNVAQLAGTTTSVNSGAKDAGTLRVVLATDQPALTNKILVTPDSVALPANQSVNVAQMNGVTTSMNTGSSDAGTLRVVLADGALECAVVSAASTNSTNCKNAAGNFFGYELYNTTTTVYYLRLYNTASAPTCSSATGFIRSVPVPPAAAAGGVGGAIRLAAIGVAYGTGISYCLTGGSSSTDNTNAAVGIFGSLLYR